LRLSESAVGRDNNFNLIRLAAALSVLAGHSVGVLGLPPEREFFFDRLGVSLAEIAVDVFFVTSGFLVTASLINRRSVAAFAWARALRIFPALWVMLILTAFALGPALTSLSAKDYFASPTTRDYFAKGATLIGGVRYSLPGVFETLPLKGEFNGSLWTLPIEVRMYLYLALGWLLLSLAPMIRTKASRLIAPVVLAALFATVVSARLSDSPLNGGDIRVMMFAYGVALYFWRDRIVIDGRVMAALAAALLLASMNRTSFFLVYLVCLAPLTLCLAYVPGGGVRRFNRLGDYSYGVYIYAFPIQQTLALIFPGMSLIAMIALSATITLIVAWLSWVLIERRVLALKEDFAAATARAFRLGRDRIASAAR
jgi:peptidoglycan/LPS O-acetylase OafA/YrhL